MSVRKYRSLGVIRNCRQVISYEISILLLFIVFIYTKNSLNLTLFNSDIFFYIVCVSLILFIGIAETRRAPFDFREGESELISGYNVEYRGVSFVYLFLREYGIIIFFIFLLTTLIYHQLIIALRFAVCYIFFRSVYPRFRYDLLIYFNWCLLLPLTCSII